MLAACSGQYGRRHAQLQELQRLNSADSLMTDDSLALLLTRYFDRHGTPNDRLLAYYLLARTYYDMGDHGQALETFYRAADCADTTSSDCDHATLSRVHTQTAEVFYQQMLAASMMTEERYGLHHALVARDTLQAAFCYSRLSEGYELEGQPDSALLMLAQSERLYRLSGHDDYAAALGCSKARLLVEKGDYQGATDGLHAYERLSGQVSADGTPAPGCEIYYYVKGLLFMGTDQPDSAEHCFRRELTLGGDGNSKMSAYKGLQTVYEQKACPDSVIRFAHLSDSIANLIHREVEMQAILQLQAAYQHNRSNRMALEKTLEASRAQVRLWMALVVCLLLLMLCVAGFLYFRRELRKYTLDKRLQEADVTIRLRQMAKTSPPQTPNLDDWRELTALIDHELPAFRSQVSPADKPLSDMDYDVCMLTRIHLSPSDIYKLKNCSPSYISNIRKKLLLQLFGLSGNTELFDERIHAIH